jgi:SAM-dependent methyltransferase
VNLSGWTSRAVVAAGVALFVTAAAAAQQAQGQFEPQVGQAGKDVVWVPTPPELVEKMLDMAQVTAKDFVVDLGSGDGRNVIAAAKRGARALGVEYNPDMVQLSRRAAAKEGVGDKATFVQGDMFEADFSQATALALFLLPDNMLKLREKFLALKPGTRIVGNTFGIEGWEPDEKETVGGECSTWCTSMLWIVPANVQGTWQLPQGELSIKQDYQMISGTLTSRGTGTPIAGRLRGEEMRFTAGGEEYLGRVNGNAIEGTVKSAGANGSWKATRVSR